MLSFLTYTLRKVQVKKWGKLCLYTKHKKVNNLDISK